ncbi:MAG: cupredoxin domain-containing protein [Chloroflexota bacterium]|nr:cupredoxin domain-containing protein [Chloroflexota bacterium]
MKRLSWIGLLLAAILTACSGAATNAVRTVEVTMTDDLRYDPAGLSVNAGETVRFVVRNAGANVHEFLIGTADQQAVFAEEMADGHGGGHAADAGVSVEPGATAEFTYSFTADDRDLLIGCHQPGHYEGGMVAPVAVTS